MSNVGPEFVKRLVENHWAALVLYARQWCADPEDVVQESLLKLLRQSAPPRDAAAWIFRVVRNQAISTSRSSQRRWRRENLAGTKLSWFANTEDEIDAEIVTSALQKLPDDVREVIVTRIWGHHVPQPTRALQHAEARVNCHPQSEARSPY